MEHRGTGGGDMQLIGCGLPPPPGLYRENFCFQWVRAAFGYKVFISLRLIRRVLSGKELRGLNAAYSQGRVVLEFFYFHYEETEELIGKDFAEFCFYFSEGDALVEMWDHVASWESRSISGRPPLRAAVQKDSISTVPSRPIA